jgi:hypothetical protein
MCLDAVADLGDAVAILNDIRASCRISAMRKIVAPITHPQPIRALRAKPETLQLEADTRLTGALFIPHATLVAFLAADAAGIAP